MYIVQHSILFDESSHHTNLLRGNNRRKPITQLTHHNRHHIRSRSTRNIPIPNRILSNKHIISKLSPSPSRGRDTNMRHIPDQHDLTPHRSQPAQIFIQIRLRKRAGKLLGDDLFTVLGRQLVEFPRQFRARREDGGAGGDLVHHMDDVLAVAAGAVLGEEVRDGLPGLVDFGGLEEPRGVFVLGIDDDEGGVLDGGRGGGDADDLAEGFGVGGHDGGVLIEWVDFWTVRCK